MTNSETLNRLFEVAAHGTVGYLIAHHTIWLGENITEVQAAVMNAVVDLAHKVASFLVKQIFSFFNIKNDQVRAMISHLITLGVFVFGTHSLGVATFQEAVILRVSTLALGVLASITAWASSHIANLLVGDSFTVTTWVGDQA